MQIKKKRDKNILNIWKNTTKAQRDAELTKRIQKESKRGRQDGQIRGSFTNQH